MLLKDYLKKLPDTSPDYHDAQDALHLVSTAANHANEAMKKIDKFKKLLEIQESIGGTMELVSPTRELVKEGKIIKISARSGEHQDRYLFLFSDLLLLCSPSLIGSRVISGPLYRLRAKYIVENLEILEGDNLETANSFYIRDNEKSVELYTQTREEKDRWLTAILEAIDIELQRKSSLRICSIKPGCKFSAEDLGVNEPVLIKTDTVSKCMECGVQFSVMKRKHHCRACGAVVCYKCSNQKAVLAYDKTKNFRVCLSCFEILKSLGSTPNGISTPILSSRVSSGVCSEASDGVPSDFCSEISAACNELASGIADLSSGNLSSGSGFSSGIGESSRPESLDERRLENLFQKNRGVLDISAAEPGAIISGYMELKTHKKIFTKRWFVLRPDFVLYSFKSENDFQALTATPVPGFTVTKLQGAKNESGLNDNKDKERAFKLHHSKKQYVFLCSSKCETEKWICPLQKASRAEISSPID